jgi:hypothetical protein
VSQRKLSKLGYRPTVDGNGEMLTLLGTFQHRAHVIPQLALWMIVTGARI